MKLKRSSLCLFTGDYLRSRLESRRMFGGNNMTDFWDRQGLYGPKADSTHLLIGYGSEGDHVVPPGKRGIGCQ